MEWLKVQSVCVCVYVCAEKKGEQYRAIGVLVGVPAWLIETEIKPEEGVRESG